MSDPWKPEGWSDLHWSAFKLWGRWKPRNWRWRIAGAVNRLPGACWVDLVTWANDGTREAVERADTWRGALPPTSGTTYCRQDMERDGACYCGKLQTADFRAEMESAQLHRVAADEAHCGPGYAAAMSLQGDWGEDDDPEERPCCDYRDHGDDMGCACPEHAYSSQHPFGEVPDVDPADVRPDFYR